MKNLFGWEDSGYLDRYAGMSDATKYKKIVTKANVDMVLNRFQPFNKVKNLNQSTRTIVSYSGTNIENTKSPIVFNPGDRKNSQIIVNSEFMSKHLETIDVEDHEHNMITMMKQAYVAKSEHDAAYGRFIRGNKGAMIDAIGSGKPECSIVKSAFDVAMQVSIAVQAHIQGVPITPGTPTYAGDAVSMQIADAVLNGGTTKGAASSMMNKFYALSKLRSDYNQWMDSFKAQLEIDFVGGRLNDGDIEVMNDLVPLQPTYSMLKPKSDDGKKSSGACNVGHGKIETNSQPTFVEEEKEHDTAYQDINDTLTMDDITEKDKHNFFSHGRYDEDPVDWENRDRKMETLAEALYESLAGRNGKLKSQNPAKRLNARAIASDISDNIYVSKTELGGKHLSVNLILDTSGSMNGTYIQDSVDVINCVNKLALRGVITGNLMLSCSGASSMMKLPIDPSLLPKISAHNGGEGFRHTFAIRWKELKEADYNVALTDGQLTDGHIDRKDMEKEGIFVTGLYTQRHLAKNKGDSVKFTNRLTKWFSKSAVRSSAEELIYYMIDQAILSYDANPRRVA